MFTFNQFKKFIFLPNIFFLEHLKIIPMNLCLFPTYFYDEKKIYNVNSGNKPNSVASYFEPVFKVSTLLYAYKLFFAIVSSNTTEIHQFLPSFQNIGTDQSHSTGNSSSERQ